MEKSIGNIKLVSRPVVSSHKGEHGPDSGRLDHQREGLAKGDARSLVEPTDNPSGFVAHECVVIDPPS